MRARARATVAAFGGGGATTVAIALVAASLAVGVLAQTPAGMPAARNEEAYIPAVYYGFSECVPAAVHAHRVVDDSTPPPGLIGQYGGHLGEGGYYEVWYSQCVQLCANTPTCALALHYDHWTGNRDLCELFTRDALAPGLSFAAVADEVNDANYGSRCCAGPCNDEGVTQIGGAAAWGVDFQTTGEEFSKVPVMILMKLEPTCDDGEQNGDEEGIDCGGTGDGCDACPTCVDGVTNQDETDVDCGGGTCGSCGEGGTCLANADCAGSAACLFASTDAAAGVCGAAAAGAAAGCNGVDTVKQMVMSDGRAYLMTTEGNGDGDAVIGGTPWYILDAPASRGVTPLDASCVDD